MATDTVKADVLCILGCGNLGSAIIGSLLEAPPGKAGALPFSRYIACVRSEQSEKRLQSRFSNNLDKLTISRGDNLQAVQESDVIILGADPSDVEQVLGQAGLRDALSHKLLISVVAGWTRQKLETTLYGSETTAANSAGRARIVRTLPNIASLVGQSLTTIEVSEPSSEPHLQLAEAIFAQIGKPVRIDPRMADATTAVAGSTPAFFAIICDALIDASVAVGVPRGMAQTMIYQAMAGTAAVLQDGMHPGVLRDQGTAPEGCTIGGVMVMEEGAVRGHMGRALREAVTIARQMGSNPHVNDTRQG